MKNKIKNNINQIFEIYNYDSKLFDFEKLIRMNLNKLDELRELNDLGDLHNFFNKINLTRIEQKIYQCFKDISFQNLYFDFNRKVIKTIVRSDYKLQRIPSIRISIPGQKTVNFHNDCWYGHDEDIINIWVPLTQVRGSQSLAFLNIIENEKALKYFYKEEPSLLEIQKYCEKKSFFAEADYGQFIKFPTSSLHGTFKNQEQKTRISFDFRLNLKNNFGNKNKSFFVDIKNNKLKQNNKDLLQKERNAIGYLNQRKIFENFSISQTIQQEVIANYCQLNNLNLITQETELIGFTKSLNLNDLIYGNRKSQVKDIIIFSEKLLFLEDPENFKIVKSAIDDGYMFHFINEGYTLKKD